MTPQRARGPEGEAAPIVRPTPPISKGAAELAIAARLAALHHPPDLLAPQAVAALIAHAGGSTRRLRAALASTLFLASTEDATHIDAALVARALDDGARVRRPAALVAMRGSGPIRFWAAAAAGGAMLLALFVWQPWRSSAPTPPKPPAPPQRAAALPAPAAPAAPAATPPPRGAAPPASPVPAPRPSPPAPLAARYVAAPALPALQVAPPSTVIVMLPAGDPTASRRAEGLSRRLRDAGIAQVVLRPGRVASERRPVSYFHAGDLALARKVQAVLTDEGWPNLALDSLAPRLVRSPVGPASRRHGMVEIELP